ncbi:MAG: SDR family oxidoreductase [Alphaproteobacteria bacterium]|nr:SDR family oxidoreductase [Alphaproteobacteria bacterium]
MAKRTALVIGGLGTIGRNVIAAIEAAGGWEIIGLSRRAPTFSTSARFISVDLADRAQAEDKLGGLTQVTHMFYCALASGVDSSVTEPNLRLLVNSVGVVEPIAKGLESVVLNQGAKYYGTHIGPTMCPTPETAPRHMPPNFYYDQEDWLAEQQRSKTWTYALVRPALVVGVSQVVSLNILNCIVVYGTICRELEIPFDYPGTDAGYRALSNYTDAGMLARFELWSATAPQAANQAFNLTNASGFRWEHLWNQLGAALGAKPGRPRHFKLSQLMADKGPLWDRIVAKYGLAQNPFADIADWSIADHTFGRAWDYYLEDRKRIQAGFVEVLDTQQMFLAYFARLRAMRMIP